MVCRRSTSRSGRVRKAIRRVTEPTEPVEVTESEDPAVNEGEESQSAGAGSNALTEAMAPPRANTILGLVGNFSPTGAIQFDRTNPSLASPRPPRKELHMSDNDDKSAQDSLADKTGQTGGAAVASGTAAYTTGPANSYGSADPRIPDKASPSDISNGKTIDDTPNTSQQAGLVAADDARSGGTPRNDFAFMSDPNLSGAQKAAAFEDHVNVDDGHGNTVHTIGQMTGFFLDAPNEITGAACGDGNNAIVGNFHYVEKVDLGGGNFEYRNEGSNDTVTFNADGSYSFGNGGASDYAGFYNNGKPEFRQDASGYTRWDRNGNWQNVAGDKDCHQTWGFADGSKATFTKDGKVVVHTADGKDVTYQTQGTLGLGNVTHVGSDGSLSLDNKALGADTQGNPETRN